MMSDVVELPIPGTNRSHLIQRLAAISEWLWWPLTLIFLTISAWVHMRAGLTLPLPWDDENSFMWPAINFADKGTLLAPELNPDRPVMWMPPLFMLIYGTIFKAVGFSLETARWSSWIIMAGAFVSLGMWIKRFPLALLSLVLLGLLFLSGTMVSIGNVARMDGLALLSGGVCFGLLTRGQVWMAASVVAIGVLVHPNSAYIGAAGALVACATAKSQKWRPSRGAAVCLIIAAAAWIAYITYVSANWEAFINDMSAQFQRKARRNPLPLLLEWPQVVFVAAFAIGGLVSSIRKSEFTGPMALGGVCLVLPVIGHEMWYEAFKLVAFWLLAMSVLWCINAAFLRWLPTKGLARMTGIAVAFVPILAYYHHHGFVEGPRGYPSDLTWGWGMTLERQGVSYFTDTDRETVSDYINCHLPRHELTRIEFYPQGDGLLFYNALVSNAIIFQPHFTEILPDAIVVRFSRYIPSWWGEKQAQAVKHIPAGMKPFYIRDQTEQWFLVDLRTMATDS